jgi:ArsR family transcriptional regulator
VITPATCRTPLTAVALDDEQAEALAGVFAALADPGRVKILHRLSSVAPAGVCVCDLVEPLGFTQSAVSYHLKILREAGLISRDRRGQFNYYALRAEALGRVAALVGHDPLADAS